jgi:hypothetical protein
MRVEFRLRLLEKLGRRFGVAALALASTACWPGCTVWQNARRTVITQPFQFSWKYDRGRSLKTYSLWAEQAWREYGANCGQAPSGDFAAGFKDGFVDYVYAGGTGEPPPVPPREYWNVGNRTFPGQDRASQWFAGYRQGSAVARQGGYRQQATVKGLPSGALQWDQDLTSEGPDSILVMPRPRETSAAGELVLPGAPLEMLPEGETSAPPAPTEEPAVEAAPATDAVPQEAASAEPLMPLDEATPAEEAEEPQAPPEREEEAPAEATADDGDAFGVEAPPTESSAATPADEDFFAPATEEAAPEERAPEESVLEESVPEEFDPHGAAPMPSEEEGATEEAGAESSDAAATSREEPAPSEASSGETEDEPPPGTNEDEEPATDVFDELGSIPPPAATPTYVEPQNLLRVNPAAAIWPVAATEPVQWSAPAAAPAEPAEPVKPSKLAVVPPARHAAVSDLRAAFATPAANDAGPRTEGRPAGAVPPALDLSR